MTFKRWTFITVLVLLAAFLAACGSTGSDTSAAAQAYPEYVQRASHTVQVAYQFAVEHPDMLTHQPCYCGCGAMGHINNLGCFIQNIDEKGLITFDNHAAGCGICVDIALDVKRLSEEGKSQLEIRRYIDATYGSFGPSTDTPLPEA